MKSNSFSVFLSVVDEMSFTKAASRLHMTQQSVSGHITRLESQYGVTLFIRKPNLKLTPEGHSMVNFAKIMINAETNMLANFADINKSYYGEITLGISRLRSQIFFLPIWNNYHPLHPNISLNLYERNTQYLIEALSTGLADMIIGVDIAPSKNHETILLAKENCCAIINQELLKNSFPGDYHSIIQEAKERGISINILKKLPLITLPKSNVIRNKIDKLFFRIQAFPRVILETNEQQIIIKSSFKGDGVGILTPGGLYGSGTNPSSPHISQGFLPKDCHLFNIRDAEENTLSLSYRKDTVMSNYLEDLKEVIIKEFNNYNRFLSKMYQ